MVAFDGKTECSSEYSPLTENETKHKAIYMVYEDELEIGHGRIKKRDGFLLNGSKAKCLSISGKQMLCDKREDCLEKVCRNI